MNELIKMSENAKAATNKKASRRVIAYVDGYNLYRSVNEWAKPEENSDLVKYHLESLVLHCLKESHRLKKKNKETEVENLKKINFYTARPLNTRKGGFSIKHYEEWTGRQKSLKIVEVIEGVHVPRSNSKEEQSDINIAVRMFSNAFKKGDCNKDNLMKTGIKVIKEIYRHKYKEKQTDVNIAVDMISGALKNSYDKAVLISDDTDFWRLILKCLRAGKHVLVLGTKKRHPIKKKLNGKEKIEHHSAELRKDISELRQYMNHGTLDFYQITKDDIEKYPDSKYINKTKNNN